MPSVNPETLPYPIAKAILPALDEDIPVLQLKRIALGANKIIRFLAWLAVAESLYLKKPLSDKAIHILSKKKHLNSDWVRLLEETGVSFVKRKMRILASKLLQLRNYEAHTEKDPLSIPQSMVELALDTFKAFIVEIAKLLSKGELVWIDHSRVHLTGSNPSNFTRMALIDSVEEEKRGLFWIQIDGINFKVEPFMFVEEECGCFDVLILEQVQENYFGYVSTESSELVKKEPDRAVQPYIRKREQTSRGSAGDVDELINAYTKKTLESMQLPLYYIERIEPIELIQEQLLLHKKVVFLGGRAGSGVSSILFSLVNSLIENTRVLYVRGIKQLREAFDTLAISIHGTAILKDSVIVLDKLESEDDLLSILRFLDVAEEASYTFVIGTNLSLKELLDQNKKYWDLDYEWIDVLPLSDDEVKEFIDKYTQAHAISAPLKLLYAFLQNASISIRTPSFLKLLCESYSERLFNIRALDMNHLFQMVEEKLLVKRELIESINFLCHKIRRKKINQISFQEAKRCGSDVEVLINKGILESNFNGYRFANEDYLHYKIAGLIFSEKGILPSFRFFVSWEKAIPYYIALLAERIDLEKVGRLITKINSDQMLDVVDALFPNEESFRSLMKLEGMVQYGLDYGRKLRDQGLYSSALRCFSMLQSIPRMNVSTIDRLNAEVMITKYQMDGTIQDIHINDPDNCPHYYIYKGHIEYVRDNYREAQKQLTKALQQINNENSMKSELRFRLAEILNDRGAYKKTEELLESIYKESDIGQLDIGRVDNLYGVNKMEQGFVNEGLKYLESGLVKFKETNNFTGISKSMGDIGLAHWLLGNWQKAHEFLEENLYMSSLNDDLYGIVAANQLLGDLCLVTGDLEQAKEHYQESFKAAIVVDNRWRELAALSGYHICLYYLEYRESQPDTFPNYKDKLREKVFGPLWCNVFRNESILLMRWNPEEGLKKLNKARNIALRIQAGFQVALCDAILIAIGKDIEQKPGYDVNINAFAEAYQKLIFN